MATIYRFIVEQKMSGGNGDGKKVSSPNSSKRTTAKKGKSITLLGSAKGGVEHNRKMRAVNTLFNKGTGGAHEKVMRVGRAGLGLVRFNSETGAFAGLSPTAIAILIAFTIQTVLRIQSRQIELANRNNNANFKAMENGFSQVHGEYTVARNYWDGATTFNENK